MSEITQVRRGIKLWQVLAANVVVGATLALLPNQSVAGIIFLIIEGGLVLALLVLLVIAIARKLAKR